MLHCAICRGLCGWTAVIPDLAADVTTSSLPTLTSRWCAKTVRPRLRRRTVVCGSPKATRWGCCGTRWAHRSRRTATCRLAVVPSASSVMTWRAHWRICRHVRVRKVGRTWRSACMTGHCWSIMPGSAATSSTVAGTRAARTAGGLHCGSCRKSGRTANRRGPLPAG